MKRLLNYLTPGDRWILAGLLFIAVAGFVGNWFVVRGAGKWVVVERDNRLLFRLPLDKNGDYFIPGAVGGLKIRIANGKVWVSQSTCPHKICVKMGKIAHPGQLIVCVPNHLVIRIAGKTNPSFDVITE